MSAKVDGYVYNRDTLSDNFRALFTLQFNQWAKKSEQKKPSQLWPLSFDNNQKQTSEDMYERNKKLIESIKT